MKKPGLVTVIVMTILFIVLMFTGYGQQITRIDLGSGHPFYYNSNDSESSSIPSFNFTAAANRID